MSASADPAPVWDARRRRAFLPMLLLSAAGHALAVGLLVLGPPLDSRTPSAGEIVSVDLLAAAPPPAPAPRREAPVAESEPGEPAVAAEPPPALAAVDEPAPEPAPAAAPEPASPPPPAVAEAPPAPLEAFAIPELAGDEGASESEPEPAPELARAEPAKPAEVEPAPAPEVGPVEPEKPELLASNVEPEPRDSEPDPREVEPEPRDAASLARRTIDLARRMAESPRPRPRAAPAPRATAAAAPATAPAAPAPLAARRVDEGDVARGGTLLGAPGGFPILESRYESYGTFRQYADAMRRLGARFVVVRAREIVGTIDPWTLETGPFTDPGAFSPRARDFAGEPELVRASRAVRREHGSRAEVMLLVPRRIDAGLFGGIARALEAAGREPSAYREIRARYERGPSGGLRLRVESAVRRDGREEPLPLLFDLDGLAGRGRA